MALRLQNKIEHVPISSIGSHFLLVPSEGDLYFEDGLGGGVFIDFPIIVQVCGFTFTGVLLIIWGNYTIPIHELNGTAHYQNTLLKALPDTITKSLHLFTYIN